MALVKPSFSLQSGITLTNPAELEYYSGPWMGTTLDAAVQAAKDNIPNEYRYHGMKIKLLVVQSSQPLPNPPFYNSVNALNFTSCKAYTYWFSEGIANANLIPYTPDKDVNALGTAAGSTGEIQFNKNGALSASSGLTFDTTKSALTSSFVVATKGLSGSLTRLSDGTSYLREGTNISIVTGSKGEVTISSTAVSNPGGNNTQVQFNDAGAFAGNSAFTFNKNVGALSSSFVVATGLTGSLTQISSGVPYLVALSSSVMAQTGGISISTGSNGQVSASYYVFPDDIRVALPTGRTFGRYKDGDTIPAIGKTPAEIIKMATFYAVEPQIDSFTVTPDSIPFNHGSTNTTLAGNYTIKSYLGTLKNLKYLYQKSSNLSETTPSNSWTTVYQGTTPPSPLTYSITDTALSKSKHWFRFEVTGSYDEASSMTSNIITSDYVTPSSTGLDAGRYTQRYSGYVGGSETFILRPKGNVSTGIGSTINFSSYVPVSSYSTEFSTDGGTTWASPAVAGTSATYSPTTSSPITVNSTTNHVPSMGSSTDLRYRFKVSDTNTNVANPKIISPANGSIVFDDVVFFGLAPGTLGTKLEAIVAGDLNTGVIEGLPNKIFISKLSNPKIITFTVSGVTEHNWVVAFPTNSGLSIDPANSYIDSPTFPLGANQISTSINFSPTSSNAGSYSTNYTVWNKFSYNPLIDPGQTKTIYIRLA